MDSTVVDHPGNGKKVKFKFFHTTVNVQWDVQKTNERLQLFVCC